MHIVRSSGGGTIIEELDLSVHNLCSGFSYVLTLLGSSYIWHGRGSNVNERAAARVYARNLSEGEGEVVELKEGEGDEDDELFWMMLGEREGCGAEYWRWRSESRGGEDREGKAWKVVDGTVRLFRYYTISPMLMNAYSSPRSNSSKSPPRTTRCSSSTASSSCSF